MFKPKKYLENILGQILAQDILWSPTSVTAISIDGPDLVFIAALSFDYDGCPLLQWIQLDPAEAEL